MTTENTKFTRVFTGNKVKARYSDSENPLYRHNAFVEALPPLMEPEVAFKKMRRVPAYNDDMRTWPSIKRLDQVMSLANLIVPLPDHLLLEQKISRVIRNGYMSRNPLDVMWVKQLNSGFEGLCLEDRSQMPVMRSNASGFAIVGPSGSGKSTTVESVLGLYPQLIIHSEYHGEKLAHEQLVWLKLECPSNGSTKALCQAFFATVDEVLGTTNYLEKFGNGRRTQEAMMPSMARVARLHGLGVLVIDEIQRLNVAASGGVEEMMHFFTQLTNLVGVPVVLIGTSAALNLVTEKFSQARRFTGQGDHIWSPMAHEGSWDHFLEHVWRYQFTNTPTPLTPALNAEMYKQTCGIIDLAVKLYMMVQWSLIGTKKGGREVITPELIRKVAKDKFGFVAPALKKLKTGNVDNTRYLDDLLPSRELLKDFLEAARERIVLGSTLKTVANKRENDKKDGEDRQLLKLASMLVMAGYTDEIAEEASRRALDRHAEELEITTVSLEAMKVAAELKSEKDAKLMRQQTSRVKRNKRADDGQATSDDLRDAVKAGCQESPHAALTTSGNIKGLGELFEGGESV